MSEFVLETQGVCKNFGGISALSNVDFQLRAGEIHALVGENGAGKSTFIKTLGGVFKPDAGSILVDGNRAEIEKPEDAHNLGIRIVYQELNLVPPLTIAENLFLGEPPVTGPLGTIDRRLMEVEAEHAFHQLGCKIDVRRKVRDLSVAEQQLVEIARATRANLNILVLDEPTAALTEREAHQLRQLVKRLVGGGVSAIFISHKLNEVMELADRATVFRDGHVVGTVEGAEITRDTLIRMMVGREITDLFPKTEAARGEPAMVVEGLCGARFSNVSFEVREGEILGISGLMGSGRTELVRGIFGADPVTSGRVVVGDEEVKRGSPSASIKAGLALVPEDRKGQGLILGMPVAGNILIPNLNAVSRLGMVIKSRAEELVGRLVSLLQIASQRPMTQKAGELSGGNQQKVVVAKWLGSNAKVLLLDEPTRGIDVGAKSEIHRLMGDFVKAGKAIVMVSSELPEVLGVSDRIMVMHEGQVRGILPRETANEENVIKLALE